MDDLISLMHDSLYEKLGFIAVLELTFSGVHPYAFGSEAGFAPPPFFGSPEEGVLVEGILGLAS